MLLLKENKLTIENPLVIDSHDCTLTLTPDNLDCNYFGLITFWDKTIKTIQFIKIDTCFKARLVLSKEEFNSLDNSKIKIISISTDFSQESNSIPITFNKEKIGLTIKQQVSKDIAELKKDIVSLQSKLESLSLGKPITNPTIVNKDYIKPGMTLVAIDSETFIAAFPFMDVIKKVNGQAAVDGVVEIDASMIKYNTERTIEDQMKIIGEAIKVQNKSLKTISSELNVLSKKLAELSVKVETHLDNGII